MASVIDLRENPQVDLSISQNIGHAIGLALNDHRQKKMQQRVIGVLNDPNTKAEDKRKILLRDADFLRSPMGQQMMVQELDTERRMQMQWQQQYNQARLGLVNAQTQATEKRAKGTPSEAALLAFASKMVEMQGWTNQEVQDFVISGGKKWPTEAVESDGTQGVTPDAVTMASPSITAPANTSAAPPTAASQRDRYVRALQGFEGPPTRGIPKQVTSPVAQSQATGLEEIWPELTDEEKRTVELLLQQGKTAAELVTHFRKKAR